MKNFKEYIKVKEANMTSEELDSEDWQDEVSEIKEALERHKINEESIKFIELEFSQKISIKSGKII